MALCFIGWQGKPITGLLDTEEKVAEARKNLEDSTAKLFADLKIAKMKSWQMAHQLVLD